MTTGFSRADFINAVERTSVSEGVKEDAENFQASVWDNSGLRWKVKQTGANSLEFIEGGRVNGEGLVSKLTATMDIGPTHDPLPNPLIHSQMALLDAINEGHPDYVGAGSYWIASHAYGDSLQLGASAMAEGPGELVGVYGKDLTAYALTAPTKILT